MKIIKKFKLKKKVRKKNYLKTAFSKSEPKTQKPDSKLRYERIENLTAQQIGL